MAFKSLTLGPFKDGVNTRDQVGELGPDEASDARNVTLDERGALEKRLGFERRYPLSLGAGLVSNIFEWKSRGFIVVQEGPRMHVNNGAAFLTWSTSDRCGMCEFLGNLILIHPVDGVRMYDGTTVTGPFTNSPLGNTCAAWQNKCWFAGNPTNPARVTYTDIGAMTFNVNGWNELREKDSSKVTLLTGASGLDVSGRPGLLAFKEDSAYRIYDSTTGAYNTIDSSIGCGSSIGAISAYGRTYVVSARGIYYTNGVDPMIEASGRIENQFSPTVINHTRTDLYAAGRYQDRLRFSLPAAGQTTNSIAIELHPLSGWIMLHTDAASAYASTKTDLIMGSPTSNGLVFNGYRTGADDGVAITSWFQSAWVNPSFGNLINIRRARFIGAGAFDAKVLKNFESGGSGATMSVNIVPVDALYDAASSVYDTDDVYGPSKFQDHRDFYSVAKVREFALRIDETSSLTRTGQPLLGGVNPERGAWMLSRALFWAIDLGLR